MPVARGRPQGMELVVQLGFAEVMIQLAFLLERGPRRAEIGELEVLIVADVLLERHRAVAVGAADVADVERSRFAAAQREDAGCHAGDDRRDGFGVEGMRPAQASARADPRPYAAGVAS